MREEVLRWHLPGPLPASAAALFLSPATRGSHSRRHRSSGRAATRLQESWPTRRPVAERRSGRHRVPALSRAGGGRSLPARLRRPVPASLARARARGPLCRWRAAGGAVGGGAGCRGAHLPAGSAARQPAAGTATSRVLRGGAGRGGRASSRSPAAPHRSPSAMGSSQSVEIPGGGTEGYHVLRVRAPTAARALAGWRRGLAAGGGGARRGRFCQGPGRFGRPVREAARVPPAQIAAGPGSLPLVGGPAGARDGVRRPRRAATRATGEEQPRLLLLLLISSAPLPLHF